MRDWSDKTILIAEDDTINYNLLNIMLRPTKINVLWAKNGVEAVDIFFKNSKVGAILMDIQMPVMDGNEATARIREKNKEVPVIVISAYTSKEVRQKAADAGSNEFINKPVQSERLLQIIESYL
jgi:CheY-like chemotaxis protein